MELGDQITPIGQIMIFISFWRGIYFSFSYVFRCYIKIPHFVYNRIYSHRWIAHNTTYGKTLINSWIRWLSAHARRTRLEKKVILIYLTKDFASVNKIALQRFYHHLITDLILFRMVQCMIFSPFSWESRYRKNLKTQNNLSLPLQLSSFFFQVEPCQNARRRSEHHISGLKSLYIPRIEVVNAALDEKLCKRVGFSKYLCTKLFSKEIKIMCLHLCFYIN